MYLNKNSWLLILFLLITFMFGFFKYFYSSQFAPYILAGIPIIFVLIILGLVYQLIPPTPIKAKPISKNKLKGELPPKMQSYQYPIKKIDALLIVDKAIFKLSEGSSDDEYFELMDKIINNSKQQAYYNSLKREYVGGGSNVDSYGRLKTLTREIRTEFENYKLTFYEQG